MAVYTSWIEAGQAKLVDLYGDSHWLSFKEARRKFHENTCLQTNKLVTTLDELINVAGYGKRRESAEKPIVEWKDDKLVSLCPYCAKRFTVARRRHHCRVCGAILCNNCSNFLEYKSACRLVRPAKLYVNHYDRLEDRIESRETDDVPSIRTCEDCKMLLDKRLRLIEDYYCQPELDESYEKLRKSMTEADDMIISHSLLTTDQEEQTKELKAKIQDLKQLIAGEAVKLKRMAKLATNERLQILLGSIGESIGFWLRETVEDKLTRLQRARVGQASGWMPEQPSLAAPADNADEDPLETQIRLLAEYKKQAQLHKRYEEVHAIEASLRDLQIELALRSGLAG